MISAVILAVIGTVVFGNGFELARSGHRKHDDAMTVLGALLVLFSVLVILIAIVDYKHTAAMDNIRQDIEALQRGVE